MNEYPSWVRVAQQRERQEAMEWARSRKGDLKIVLGQLMAAGYCPEKLYKTRPLAVEFSYPEDLTLGFILTRDHNSNRSGYKTVWRVECPNAGWVSGKAKDPVIALQKFIDKWVRS